MVNCSFLTRSGVLLILFEIIITRVTYRASAYVSSPLKNLLHSKIPKLKVENNEYKGSALIDPLSQLPSEAACPFLHMQSYVKEKSAPAVKIREHLKRFFLRKPQDKVLKHQKELLTSSKTPFDYTVFAKSNKVKTLPFIGPRFYAYSRSVPLTQPLDYYTKMNQRFGDLYRTKIPTYDENHKYVYVTTNPQLMEQIVRNEGTAPTGFFSQLWHGKRLLKRLKSPLYHKGDHGPLDEGIRWKKMMQVFRIMMRTSKTDSFKHNLLVLAKENSKFANYAIWNENTDDLLQCFMIDLFAGVYYGDKSEITKKSSTNATVEDETWTLHMNFLKSFELAFRMAYSLREAIIIKKLKLPSFKTLQAMKLYHESISINSKKIHNFRRRWRKGELSDLEKTSCLMKGIKYHYSGNSQLSDEEMEQMVSTGAVPSIVATYTTLFWILIHLSQNKHVQSKLRCEIRNASSYSQENGYLLTNDIFDKHKTPYLNAVLRENLRITPTASVGFPMMKENKMSDVNFDGMFIPQGTMMQLDNHSKGMDGSIIENPMLFQPERWFPDAVKARSGTEAEALDHLFYNQPYGIGKRMCPGKDIGESMVRAMLAQLVLDWDIFPTTNQTVEDMKTGLTGIHPKEVNVKFVPIV